MHRESLKKHRDCSLEDGLDTQTHTQAWDAASTHTLVGAKSNSLLAKAFTRFKQPCPSQPPAAAVPVA